MSHLSFNALNDNDLLDLLHNNVPSLHNFRNLHFDPLIILDEKYNSDLNVNYFFNNLRQMKIPDSNDTSLDSLNFLGSNNFNNLNLNIRSIPANLQLFTDIVLSQTNIYSKLDVLAFTEVRLDQHLVSMYQIPGYNMFTTCRNRYVGGVALYVASKYNATKSEYFSLSNNSIECLGVECKIFDKSYISVCIYRPPSGDKTTFLNTLLDTLTTVFDKTYTAVFILGDFNLDLHNYNNNFVYEFITLMYSFSLFPVITKPTRVTDNTASILDHLWTTEVESNINKFIIKTDLTDHLPTISQFKLQNLYKVHLFTKK